LQDYVSSKTLSEKEILNYNKEGQGLQVVSLACALVGGDTILPYVPGSMQGIISPLTGTEIYHIILKFLQALLGSLPLVHIEDVCEAHIFCIERPVMAGRYLCAVDYPMMKDIVDYFAEKYPDLKLIKE
jgi:nucleoside-diphosphate-sugar epimerase